MSKSGFWMLLTIAAAAMGTFAGRLHAQTQPKFIVHEWGVMVKSAAGESLPLIAPAEMTINLPEFVPRHEQVYKPLPQNQKVWRKPVLYFYGSEGLAIDVRIGTPLGHPLAYWPMPDRYHERLEHVAQGENRHDGFSYDVRHADGMQWTGTLTKSPVHQMSKIESGHWWSTARDVPASYFNSATASERFIFYEATAQLSPAIRSELSDGALTLRNSDSQASGPLVVLLNDGNRIKGHVIQSVPGAGSAEISRGTLLAMTWTPAQAADACARQWQQAGMTPAEARAIVEIWKPDLTEGAGVLVIGRIPPPSYDAMFPLAITPKPDELKRVGMVFDTLEAQPARLNWLPGLRRNFEEWGKGLGDGDYRRRREAAHRFAAAHDLAEPYLNELRSSSNPEIAGAARVLLRRLQHQPPTRPATAPSTDGAGPRQDVAAPGRPRN
jgi:hypothetical protein